MLSFFRGLLLSVSVMLVFIFFTTDKIPIWLGIPSIIFLLYYILVEYLPHTGMSSSKNRNADESTIYVLEPKKYPLKFPELAKECREPKANYRKSSWGITYIIIFGLLFLGLMATIGFSINTLADKGEDAIKKALQGGSFFISLTVSLIYYFMNRDKFKSVVDTVGFFTGVSIAPPTVIGFLM